MNRGVNQGANMGINRLGVLLGVWAGIYRSHAIIVTLTLQFSPGNIYIWDPIITSKIQPVHKPNGWPEPAHRVLFEIKALHFSLFLSFLQIGHLSGKRKRSKF